MSAALCWYPPSKEKVLPDALKFAVQRRMQLRGGPWAVGQGEIEYFRGLADAGVSGADLVVAAIEKYGEITLDLRY